MNIVTKLEVYVTSIVDEYRALIQLIAKSGNKELVVGHFYVSQLDQRWKFRVLTLEGIPKALEHMLGISNEYTAETLPSVGSVRTLISRDDSLAMRCGFDAFVNMTKILTGIDVGDSKSYPQFERQDLSPSESHLRFRKLMDFVSGVTPLLELRD